MRLNLLFRVKCIKAGLYDELYEDGYEYEVYEDVLRRTFIIDDRGRMNFYRDCKTFDDFNSKNEIIWELIPNNGILFKVKCINNNGKDYLFLSNKTYDVYKKDGKHLMLNPEDGSALVYTNCETFDDLVRECSGIIWKYIPIDNKSKIIKR